MRNKVNLVVTCDDKYIQHLVAMLVSVFENTGEPSAVRIYFLNHGIEDLSKNDLLMICEEYRAEIIFISIDKSIFKGFFVSNHINEVAYYRILAPLLLPKKVEKYIYLDIDIILNEDIQLLFNISLGDKIVGAVFDPYGEERYNDLDIKDEGYFNSGVLLVNREKWLNQKITDKVMKFIHEHDELKYHDQDALNFVLKKKWLCLNNAWNVQTSFFEMDPIYQVNPKIIHYTSHRKPWNLICYHPFKNMYYKYLKLTKWAEYKPIPIETQEILNSEVEFIIFGTGSITEEFMKYVNHEKVRCFLDNNYKKINQIFYGKVIKLPSEEIVKDYKVIICSSYYNEIKKQLEEYGLILNKDFYLGYN